MIGLRLKMMAAALGLAVVMGAPQAQAATVWSTGTHLGSSGDVTSIIVTGADRTSASLDADVGPLAVPEAVDITRIFQKSGNVSTAIVDIWAFTLDLISSGSAVLQGTFNSNPLNFTPTKLEFGEVIGAQGSWSISPVLSIAVADPFSLTLLGLDPSKTYGFRVMGDAVGTNGGSYDLNFDVSQVPVPPAFLLFGSGLIGVTLLSRRRRQRRETAAS